MLWYSVGRDDDDEEVVLDGGGVHVELNPSDDCCDESVDVDIDGGSCAVEMMFLRSNIGSGRIRNRDLSIMLVVEARSG